MGWSSDFTALKTLIAKNKLVTNWKGFESCKAKKKKQTNKNGDKERQELQNEIDLVVFDNFSIETRGGSRRGVHSMRNSPLRRPVAYGK